MKTSWKVLYRVGTRGSKVTVEERWPGSPLYLRVKGRRVSTGTRDLLGAKILANSRSEKLAAGQGPERRFTVGEVMAAYLTRQSPKHGAREREADQRRAELWCRYFGGKHKAEKIEEQDLEEFVEARMSGALGGRGVRVQDSGLRVEVGARTTEADIMFLQRVLNWAARHRDPATRQYYLMANPVRGFGPPREKNPKRPVATESQYRALVVVAPKVSRDFKRLLFLANHTGRRIQAICLLEDTDYLPGTGDYGSIRWRAETDKMGRERIVPCSRAVGAVMRSLVQERTGPLFPTRNGRPIDRFQARRWGHRAAALAGIKWPGWHAFRRKWASDRRHLDLVDVARTGGWDDIRTMIRSYIDVDLEAMQRIMEGR